MTTKEIDPRMPIIDVARETLTGDVRDHLFEFLKHNKEAMPFSAMSLDKQKEIIDRASEFADKLVERAVSIIASDGRETMRFSVKGIQQTTKGNVKLTLETPFTMDVWSHLGPASTVEIIVADAKPYEGERRGRYRHASDPQLSIIPEDDEDGEQPVMDQTKTGKRTAAEKKDPSAKAAKATEEPKRDGKVLMKDGELTDDGYMALAGDIHHITRRDRCSPKKALSTLCEEFPDLYGKAKAASGLSVARLKKVLDVTEDQWNGRIAPPWDAPVAEEPEPEADGDAESPTDGDGAKDDDGDDTEMFG